MPRDWLAGLLRARQAQEDAAQVDLARAHRIAKDERERVRYHADRLDSLAAAGAAATAPVFTAAAAALQAAAATHAAACAAATRADHEIVVRRDSLIDAALARRSAEVLHEQRLETERAQAERAGVRDADEVASRMHRAAGDGSGA